jgi:hypothetical protein
MMAITVSVGMMRETPASSVDSCIMFLKICDADSDSATISLYVSTMLLLSISLSTDLSLDSFRKNE